jgi:hypothetical protein
MDASTARIERLTPHDEKKFTRRSYYAMIEDDQAVARIRQKFGCSTDSDAVRLALRLVASDALAIKLAPTGARKVIIKFTRR